VDHARYAFAVSFINRLDKRYSTNKAVGWVYALRNAEFKKPLLKIGMTTTSPHQRAAELGAATGVPGKFDLVYFVHASSCARAEFYVHQRLARFRTSGEFFEVPIGRAVEAMDEAAARFPINLDMAHPKKRGGWGNDWLPQVFQHSFRVCPNCGDRNRIHSLAVPFRPKCGRCGIPFTG